MTSLRTFAGSLLRWLRSLPGAKTSAVVYVPQDPQEGYKVVAASAAGGDIHLEFFCREHRYRISHEAWWMPTYTRREFQVYCSYSAHLSKALRAKLEEGYVSRPLLPWPASRANQKKAVIDRYVEQLVRHFRNPVVY